MAVTLKQARTLCTASELELVRASMGSKPQSLTPARLRQKVTRARRLRGKFRDVGDRQRRESRGKQAARGARPASGNLGTRLKEQLFTETLERFEQALQAAESREATQTEGGRSTKKKTSRKVATKKTASKASGRKAASKKAAKKTTKKAGKKASKKKRTKSTGRKASAKLSAAGTTTSISAARKKTRKASTTLPARKKSAKKTTKKSKKKAARSAQTAKKKRLKTKDRAAEGPRKARRFARSGQTRTQGHVSGRNRRNQARRDS